MTSIVESERMNGENQLMSTSEPQRERTATVFGGVMAAVPSVIRLPAGTPRQAEGGNVQNLAQPSNGTSNNAAAANSDNQNAVAAKAAPPSKLLGRPSQAWQRSAARATAARTVSMQPAPRVTTSSSSPTRRAKSSRRVLVGSPNELLGGSSSAGGGGGNDIPFTTKGSRYRGGQRRNNFVDPTVTSDGAVDFSPFASPLRPSGARVSPAAQTQPRKNGSPSFPTAPSASVVPHTLSGPQHRLPTRASAPLRNPAGAESAGAAQPRHRRRLPGSDMRPLTLSSTPASRPYPTTLVSAASDAAVTPPSPLASTVAGASHTQSPRGEAEAEVDASGEGEESNASAALDPTLDMPPAATDAAVADLLDSPAATTLPGAPQKESVIISEIYRDNKHIVMSRPSPSSHTIRMSELTRPSEAYKMALQPTLQRSALARRSRQPRKVLNVFLTKYPIIRKLAEELGFEMETAEDELNEYKFNLCWSDTVLSLMRLVRLSNWQRTNHFPSMYLLCRKGHLGTTLGKLRRKLPNHFAYYPRTWSMRSERLQFTQYMAAVRQRRLLKYFILKPNSGCQGRGIIVARDPLTALDDHALDNYIVQEYVHRPLLLEGKKFDLRVYVLLTSIRHPSIFIFNDGLVRICTEPYETPNEENVKQACKHLTNYAVNKKSADYVFNTDVEHMDVGSKRNFGFLNRWLEEGGYSADKFWDEVGVIIVKTILAAQPTIAKVYDSCFPTGFNDGYCCFEVLGFDILIDHKLRPWLMEVNHTPSFATETPLDMDIKSRLITEVWSIIDCKATDYEKDRQREREEFARRNMPPWASNHPLYGTQLSKSGSRRAGAEEADAAQDATATAAGIKLEQGYNGEEGTPVYVQTRRKHEDSKLKNFKRIYPSPYPEIQEVYDTIQTLATIESANGRLYYNSTVAAPTLPFSVQSPLLPMRSNAVVPTRARSAQLGPVLTTSRTGVSTGSPTTVPSQRAHLYSLPATLMPPGEAPATIAPASVSNFAAATAVNGDTGATFSNAYSTAATSGEAVDMPSPALPGDAENSLGWHRSLDADSGAKTASDASSPHSSTARSEAGMTGTSPQTRTGTATTTQQRRDISLRAASGAATQPTAAVADVGITGGPPKPHIAEVHRRARSGRSPVTPLRPVAQGTNSKNGSGPSRAPAIADLQQAVPTSPGKFTAAADAPRHPHDGAEPPFTAQALQQPSTGATTVTLPSDCDRKSVHLHQAVSPAPPLPSASHDACAQEIDVVAEDDDGVEEGSGRGFPEHPAHPMLTHPEPTEEELARLATLQAILDYEAAADPEPDDNEDYNLTE